jgi:hypothetical protein
MAGRLCPARPCEWHPPRHEALEDQTLYVSILLMAHNANLELAGGTTTPPSGH